MHLKYNVSPVSNVNIDVFLFQNELKDRKESYNVYFDNSETILDSNRNKETKTLKFKMN